jgi:hypothetical protein
MFSELFISRGDRQAASATTYVIHFHFRVSSCLLAPYSDTKSRSARSQAPLSAVPTNSDTTYIHPILNFYIFSELKFVSRRGSRAALAVL